MTILQCIKVNKQVDLTIDSLSKFDHEIQARIAKIALPFLSFHRLGQMAGVLAVGSYQVGTRLVEGKVLAAA